MKFHGNVRELLIGTWKAIEKAEGKPTINAVLRAARECYGATFTNAVGFAILLPFATKAKQPKPKTNKSRRTRGELAENFSRTNGELAER